MARCKQQLAALLLLLAASASVAQAASNVTLAAAPKDDAEFDDEGVNYGGKYVTDYTKAAPLTGKFVQFAYATCPSPYDTFSFVTKVRVCKDKDGFITGLKYLSEHPTRHHDPTTVCDVVGHAVECETIKLYTEDWKWRRYNTITNVRVAKVKDGGGHWRITYIAFSFSNGDAVEVGAYPDHHGPKGRHDIKYEQWFMKPNPGHICGMNGIYSLAAVCDSKTGYLQWVKPCGKCVKKPHNYKCDADMCTKKWKKAYKGGYKGDFVENELYKDVLKDNTTESYDSYDDSEAYDSGSNHDSSSHDSYGGSRRGDKRY